MSTGTGVGTGAGWAAAAGTLRRAASAVKAMNVRGRRTFSILWLRPHRENTARATRADNINAELAPEFGG